MFNNVTRHSRTSHPAFLTIILMFFALTGCQGSGQHPANSPNCVAAFLSGAERQSEADEQRAQIARALRDMLNDSPDQLKSARYEDYQGKKDVWNARELLKRYYLSPSRAVFDDECFFRDVSAPEARDVLKKRLGDLEEGQ